ncbi:MAG: hypothetical protein IPO90_07940 [Flavobacteriales bacterium]|nr:hypothetical protein [Flavobacteriales bacterium]
MGAPQSIGLYHDTLYYSQSEVVLWGDTVNKILRFIGDTYSDTCGALQVGVGENFRSSGLLIRYNEGEQTVHVDLPNGSSSRPITLFDALGKDPSPRNRDPCGFFM